MASNELGFPLLGFPNETNVKHGDIIYECWFGCEARIALWERPTPPSWGLKKYGLNLYTLQTTDDLPTHSSNRYSYNQSPIDVDDAFEAQLAINYLIQKHLPQEVIDDINREAACLEGSQSGETQSATETC